MVVVADASPLILLARAGVQDLLATLYGEVVVPAVVWAEVVKGRPNAPGVAALSGASWIRIDARALPMVELGLDPGEMTAILLAEAMGADLLLIDERLGRRVARERGVPIRGVLGVLVEAREGGRLTALRPVLERLELEGFRISLRLVDAVLRRVGE